MACTRRGFCREAETNEGGITKLKLSSSVTKTGAFMFFVVINPDGVHESGDACRHGFMATGWINRHEQAGRMSGL